MSSFTFDIAHFALLALALMVFMAARPVAADGIWRQRMNSERTNLLTLAAIIPISGLLMLVIGPHTGLLGTLMPLAMAGGVAAGFFRGMLRLPWDLSLAGGFVLFVLVGPELDLSARTALLVPISALALCGLIWFMAGPRGAAMTILLMWSLDMVLFFSGTLQRIQLAAFDGQIEVSSLAAVQLNGISLGGGDFLCAALLGAWTLHRLRPGGRALAATVMLLSLAGMMVLSDVYALAVPATCPMLLAMMACWGLQTRPMERQQHKVSAGRPPLTDNG